MGKRLIGLNRVCARMGVLALPLALATSCSTGAPSGSLADRIQSSPEREALEKASANVGRTFWVEGPTILDSVRVCTQSVRPADRCTDEHGKLIVLDAVDGKVPAPFYYVATEGGSKGYVEASELEKHGTMVDPAITAANSEADCKRRGDPRPGMSAAQVISTCWGKPQSVNRTQTGNHIHDQFVYTSHDAYLYFDDGILTSIQTSGALR
jgi:hypothetical protein